MKKDPTPDMNKSLAFQKARRQALTSVQQFETDTRLSCVPEQQIKPLCTFRPDHRLHHYLIISPDGQFLAESYGGAIYLLDRETRRAFQVLKPVGESALPVITPDSRQVIAADPAGHIQIWEVASGTCLQVLKGDQKTASNFFLSQNGHTLLATDASGNIEVWHLRSSTHQTLPLQLTDIIAIEPDGGSFIRTNLFKIERRDIHTGECLATFDMFKRFPFQTAVAAGGTTVVIKQTLGDAVSILDLPTGHIRDVKLDCEPNKSRVGSMALSPDGRTLLASGENYTSIYGWELENGHRLEEIPGRWDDVQFSLDGKIFFSKDKIENSYCFWEISSGQRLPDVTPDGDYQYMAPALSENNRFLVTDAVLNGMTLWDLKTGRPRNRFNRHRFLTQAAVFSPDDRLLLSGGRDHTHLWDVESGHHLRTWHKDGVISALAISPDGILAAVAIGDQIHLQQLRTGEVLHRLEGHENPVFNLRFSPDGRLLFSANRTIRCWDTATGHCQKVTQFEAKHDRKGLVLNLEEHSFLTAEGGRILQRDLDSGQVLREFTGPSEEFDRFAISALACQPGGKWIAGVYFKRFLAAWKADGDGKPDVIVDLKSNCSGEIKHLIFRRNGPLMTVGADGPVSFWDFEKGADALLAQMYCLKQGYLWTTPPDDFTPNGWLHTNRPDLVSLTAVDETGKITEFIPQSDERFTNYMHLYNDEKMVMTRLNDWGRYRELLRVRLGSKDAITDRLLMKGKAAQLHLSAGAGKGSQV